MPSVKISDLALRKYINLVGAGVTKTDAAIMVKHNKQSLDRRIRNDADLKKAMDEAWVEGSEYLIEEAQRRGAEGWLEPVFQQGREVGQVRKYSDNLLMFSIKGRRPEYKENPKQDLQVQVGVKFEDRSAALAELHQKWEELRGHGSKIEIIEGTATEVGRELPSGSVSDTEGVLAEPSDVQR